MVQELSLEDAISATANSGVLSDGKLDFIIATVPETATIEVYMYICPVSNAMFAIYRYTPSLQKLSFKKKTISRLFVVVSFFKYLSYLASYGIHGIYARFMPLVS